MVILLASLVVTAPEPPTWRLVVRNDATNAAQELATAQGKKLELAAGQWRCEFVTYTEDPEVEGGRFTLTRHDGFLSCKRPAGSEEAVVLVSAASCATLEFAPGIPDEVRQFATTVVQRSYGTLRVTLGRMAKPQAKAAEQFTITGWCLRPGLPSPPMGPIPPILPTPSAPSTP